MPFQYCIAQVLKLAVKARISGRNSISRPPSASQTDAQLQVRPEENDHETACNGSAPDCYDIAVG